MDSSRLHQAPVSQTQMEQKDLLQYECNLASCYEAEYYLSLKIQEEMCNQRDTYNDPSEVACHLYTSPMPGAAATNSQGVSADHTRDTDMDCSAAIHDATSGNFHGFFSPPETVPQLSKESGGDSRRWEQMVMVGQERGAMETSQEQVTHHDGPCRKRACLNRTD